MPPQTPLEVDMHHHLIVFVIVLAGGSFLACSSGSSTKEPAATPSAASDDICPVADAGPPPVCPQGCTWNGTECRKQGGIIVYDAQDASPEAPAAQ